MNLEKSPENLSSKTLKRKQLYANHRFPVSFGCLFILILIFIFSVIFCLHIAPSLGKTAGTSIGSWSGVTKGLSEGAEAGKNAGLSAEDTKVKISNKMTASGKLQVLLVDLRLTDLYQHGKDYAALFSRKGEGTYTVDLTQSQTTYDPVENQIIIEIPEPVFTPYFDDNSVEILEEYPRPLLNGSTENGYHGYLNSIEEVEKKAQEEFSNNADLMKQAKSIAIEQVRQLAKSVCGSNASIDVQFIDSEE